MIAGHKERVRECQDMNLERPAKALPTEGYTDHA